MIKKMLNWKRIMVFLLTVILVCGLIPGELSTVQAGESANGSTAPCNVDNLNFTFQTVDGGTVSSTANGKPKLLLFYFGKDEICKKILTDLSQIENYENVDIVTINDFHTKEETIDFRKTYANGRDDIYFCYDLKKEDNSTGEYGKVVGATSSNMTYPIAVYIDANNKIQQVKHDINDAQEIIDDLNTYCNAGLNVEIYPEVTNVVNVVSGIHIYWNPATDATKYGVWRSANGLFGDYKWIANPTSTHFIDTKVESGEDYHYKITVLNTENNRHVRESSNCFYIDCVGTPDITSRVNKAAGITLGWNKVAGANGYAIYRKPYSGNSAWTRVATINNANTLTWTDTSVKSANGSIYKYTIRAIGGEYGTLSGCRNAGRTMVRLSSRTLNSAKKASATSIKCTWNTTSQATGYEVRFMVGSSVYKTFAVTNYKTGAKTFTGLKTGQNYKIQVRSYKKVAGVGTFYSAWSTEKYVRL